MSVSLWTSDPLVARGFCRAPYTVSWALEHLNTPSQPSQAEEMTLPGPRPVLHDDQQALDSAKWASTSNKPHAGGCSARGNNRSPCLAQAAVRIIETHESEMAGCNKSFTSSCFVHFLNNNRTFLPPTITPSHFFCLLCV